LRRAERVPELRLRAKSVRRELCLVAGLRLAGLRLAGLRRLAKGRSAELRARAGLPVRAVLGRTDPRVRAELRLAGGPG
jgi:hypothetical protein